MIHVGVLPRRSVTRWVRARHAAYSSGAGPLPRKDFSVLPVCGSVRPSASQRELATRT
jgi:hypothetical protein